MRLGETDFGVFEKEKLIFLNKDVFKKIVLLKIFLLLFLVVFINIDKMMRIFYFY